MSDETELQIVLDMHKYPDGRYRQALMTLDGRGYVTTKREYTPLAPFVQRKVELFEMLTGQKYGIVRSLIALAKQVDEYPEIEVYRETFAIGLAQARHCVANKKKGSASARKDYEDMSTAEILEMIAKMMGGR